MQIYAAMDQRLTLAEVADYARRVEGLGYDGLNVPDAVHDGLLIAHAALDATSRIKVATSVLVAFPRSPMVVAVAAWDLQAASEGRFELGLGSQVRGNIVGRYSTEWRAPVPRMREYVNALRAIFDCFENGSPLDFKGEHYTFNRMQPFFNPGPTGHAGVPIFLGGIGPKMTALAGEVADGHVSHPTHSAPRVLNELTLPAIAKGAERSGRAPGSVFRMVAGLTATGPSQEDVALEREAVRELFSFLFSTPAYWPALELHGWRDVGEELHQMTRAGRWGEMKGVIRDDVLDALVPCGTYDEIAGILRARYDGLATHLTFPLAKDLAHDPQASEVIAALRA